MINLFIRVTALVILMLSHQITIAGDGIIIIGHSSVKSIDQETLVRIYMGKQIQVGNVFVVAVNGRAGSDIRARFLETYLKQDEGRYTGYWRVRRSIGQGMPPREFSSSFDVISFVRSTPGAIGYIREDDQQPDLNILIR